MSAATRSRLLRMNVLAASAIKRHRHKLFSGYASATKFPLFINDNLELSASIDISVCMFHASVKCLAELCDGFISMLIGIADIQFWIIFIDVIAERIELSGG